MQQSGVRLSVCPIYRLPQQPAAGLLLNAPRAGDRAYIHPEMV